MKSMVTIQGGQKYTTMINYYNGQIYIYIYTKYMLYNRLYRIKQEAYYKQL